MYLGGEALILLAFFGVVGFQLRVGLFFVVLSSICLVWLPGISHVYLFTFWVIFALLAYLTKINKFECLFKKIMNSYFKKL